MIVSCVRLMTRIFRVHHQVSRRSRFNSKIYETAIQDPDHDVQIGIASAKNEDRVLQGRQPRRQLSGPTVRYPGLQFRARKIKNRDGEMFIGFVPAVSGAAVKAMRLTMRRWKLRHRNDLMLDE